MENLLQELSRRKVLRSLLLYAMAAWLILQVADVIAEPLLLPEWFQRSVVIAAILGFPFVAALSWVFDLTVSGLVETEPNATDNRRPLGYPSLAVATLCLIGLSVFISNQWETEINVVNIETKIASLAIIPFEGSSAMTQPHLTRLSDELTARLSNHPSLRLASDDAIRALSPNTDLSSDAAQLGVQYILSGTVAVGDKGIDLTISLFDEAEGEEIWSRDFQNAQLYVVNDLVVDELLGFLDLKTTGSSLLTTNANAYDLYLRGLQSAAANADDEEAIELFQQALVEDPRFPLPHASLCRHQVQQYRLSRSLEAFESAERFCFRALTLDNGSLEVHEAMGQIYTTSGQMDKARDSFNAALAINPQHFKSRLGLARTYLSEDPIIVETILTGLMRDQPGDPSVYSALQNLYFTLGRYEDAVEPARWSLKLNPNSEGAKLNLAGNLMLAGNFSESKQMLQTMLAEDFSRTGDIHSILATVYFFEGEYSDAAKLYNEALSREPQNALFVRNLADATWHLSGSLAAQPLFEDVVELGQRHLQINADDIEVLSCLVVAYGSLGNQEGLESTLQPLLQLAGSDPQVHYDAAVAYSRLGNAELSFQQATMAKDIGYPSALIQADPDLKGAGVSRLLEI